MNSLYFVHIEKAAGTTIHEIFRNNFLFHYIDSPYKFSKLYNNQDCYIKKSELKNLKKYIPKFKSFGGHSLRFFTDYEKVFLEDKLYGLTFLRNPIERYISHYYHQVDKMNINWTFEEFLENEPMKNFMCKKICGYGDFNRTLDLLERKKVFVGLVEYFDESLVLMKKFMDSNQISNNFDIRYEKQNINTNKTNIKVVQIIEKYEQKIIDVNKEDIKLYNYYLEKSKYFYESNEFKKELSKLRLLNEDYKFSSLKINFMKLFRKVYITNLEKLIRDNSICQF